ncbi:hypothetical protein NLJ89_g8722 [Agrocybe chaxingu]|uniref:BHLH domain-containing protein n=1 Tax=Agrocybe chaxingu TaxID=84603 RepID=A0A9W8MTT8_9AGAR|nr:hypothetical protein NLJ89_g8722 [Agrocybe chaxingu]
MTMRNSSLDRSLEPTTALLVTRKRPHLIDTVISSLIIAIYPRRRETVRKQRIESEQRRRDELREGYARLKETLPASNQKASKVSLLDRATSHIKYLEAVKDQLEIRLKGADHEVHRLRNVNEALMLNRAGAANMAPSFSN